MVTEPSFDRSDLLEAMKQRFAGKVYDEMMGHFQAHILEGNCEQAYLCLCHRMMHLMDAMNTLSTGMLVAVAGPEVLNNPLE